MVTNPQRRMPKQSLWPSPFGVKELGIRKEALPAPDTLTETDPEEEHPFLSVPFTKKVVLVSMLAIGLDLFGSFTPEAGVHEYVSAPVAVSWALGLLQSISFDFWADTIGTGATVTFIWKLLSYRHTLSDIFTVYIMLISGLAKGLGEVGSSRKVAGDQE